MKKSSPFLICSLIIHVGALLLAMALWVEPLRPPLMPPEFDVEFFEFKRPDTPPPEPKKTPVKEPPEPVVQTPTPAPPKPKPAIDMDWTATEILPSAQRDVPCLLRRTRHRRLEISLPLCAVRQQLAPNSKRAALQPSTCPRSTEIPSRSRRSPVRRLTWQAKKSLTPIPPMSNSTN